MNENKSNGKKITLIINYSCLNMGGIEVYFAYIIKYAIEKGYRVIWITFQQAIDNADFKNIIDYDKVEKVIRPSLWGFSIPPKINIEPDENVVMLTTTALSYIAYEIYRKLLKAQSFKHFYCLPHFAGEDYFPDTAFKSKFFKKYWNKKMSKMLAKIESNGGLRAFSIKHLDTYEDFYKIKIENKHLKRLASARKPVAISDNELLSRAISRKENFKIVACARFEFPHKGFLVGLIKEFAKLKSKHPNISLSIIGYGDGKAELEKAVTLLPEVVSKDIIFCGKLTREDLLESYKNSHLFVGLAGALGDAASVAMPALVTRHYTYECETYGFYTDAFEKTLSDDKGQDILPFIEKIIEMDDYAYIEMCKQTKTIIESRRGEYNPNYFFEQEEQTNVFTPMDILAALVCNFFITIKIDFGILKNKIKKIKK